MAKNRTLNEIRQSKEYQQAKSTQEAIANQQAINRSLQSKEYQTAIKSRNVLLLNPDEAIDEIVDNLNNHLFDIIFEAVNDEMHKYTVFQEQTYLTNEGMDMFEEQWFEFYHEHHGDILHKVIKNITN